MPARNGDWKRFGSVEVTQFHCKRVQVGREQLRRVESPAGDLLPGFGRDRSRDRPPSPRAPPAAAPGRRRRGTTSGRAWHRRPGLQEPTSSTRYCRCRTRTIWPASGTSVMVLMSGCAVIRRAFADASENRKRSQVNGYNRLHLHRPSPGRASLPLAKAACYVRSHPIVTDQQPGVVTSEHFRREHNKTFQKSSSHRCCDHAPYVVPLPPGRLPPA